MMSPEGPSGNADQIVNYLQKTGSVSNERVNFKVFFDKISPNTKIKSRLWTLITLNQLNMAGYIIRCHVTYYRQQKDIERRRRKTQKKNNALSGMR
jgi:hypothetical protein